MTRLEVDRIEVDGRTLLRLAGEIDLATAADFTAALLAPGPDATVVADLSAVTFMDSSGILAIDAVLRTVASDGRQLFFAPEFSDSVRTVLRVTGVLDVLPLAPANGDGAS